MQRMTTSSTFPDDLMLEYDLLHFMETEDALARDPTARAVTPINAQFQFLNVDDLLGNAGIVLDSLDQPTAVEVVGELACAKPSVGVATSIANKADQADANANISTNGQDLDVDAMAEETSSLLDDLFLNSDELLAHLEAESVKGDVAAASVVPPSPQGLHDECLTDVDVLSSPCPSMYSDASACTPPPGHFDDLPCLDKFDASISPAGTPVTNVHTEISQHLRALERSASHGHTTEEDNEEGTSDGTEDEEETQTEAIEVDVIATDDDASIQHNHDLLQKEAKYLEAQYDYLVSRAHSARNSRMSVKAKRRAREDQQHAAQKSGDNNLLSQLVVQQQAYMDNFKAMLAFAPVNDIRMALMTPIESYIHLGRDFDERRRSILALREEKLDSTYKYIEEKARGINPNQPYQYSDVFERFGKYYSVHFAVSKYEDVEVGQVVKVVYDQMAGKDESIAQAMGCLTIRESYDSIKCNFLHQRIVSSLKWSDEFEEGLPELESNSLFFCRFSGDTAVFATDYIDKDDLHPYLDKDRIRKDVSSGVVLSAHVDENGKRSVIMKKFLMAKFHMFPHNVSEKMTSILFSKMPQASQRVTKMIDQKLLASRGQPFVHACTEHLKQQQDPQPHLQQQQC